jgi:hypothetical protein
MLVEMSENRKKFGELQSAKDSLIILQIFVLLHGLLYLEIKHLARIKKLNAQQQKEVASISMTNGFAWETVSDWYSLCVTPFVTGYYRLRNICKAESLKEVLGCLTSRFNTLRDTLCGKDKFYFFFDEVSVLSDIGRGYFFHRSAFEDSKFKPETKFFEEQVIKRNRETSSNCTNFFYGNKLSYLYLILVGLQILIEVWSSSSKPIGVLAADTTLSIWDEIKKFSENSPPKSVSRHRWNTFTDFPVFTTEVLCGYMKDYFKYTMTEKDTELADNILPVRGKALCFLLLTLKVLRSLRIYFSIYS